MISFKQFLIEARMAPLYHGTSLGNARYILDRDLLQSNTRQEIGGRWISGISLTRSFKYAHHFAFHEKGYNTVVVFELDQQKIAHRNRIIPYQYWTSKDAAYDIPNQNFARLKDHKSVPFAEHANEFEEFVVGPIRNLDKIITKIHVMSDLTLEEIMTRPEYRQLRDHPKLFDSTNILKRGKWINK